MRFTIMNKVGREGSKNRMMINEDISDIMASRELTKPDNSIISML